MPPRRGATTANFSLTYARTYIRPHRLAKEYNTKEETQRFPLFFLICLAGRFLPTAVVDFFGLPLVLGFLVETGIADRHDAVGHHISGQT